MMFACARTRRAVEQAAALGRQAHRLGPAADHLARCAACSGYAADIARLSEALGTSLPHVEARDTLTDRIVANLEIRQQPSRGAYLPGRLAWSSVAAAAAAIALWASWPASAPPTQVRRGAVERPHAPAVAQVTRPATEPHTTRIDLARRTSAGVPPSAHHSAPRFGHGQRLAAASHALPKTQIAASAPTASAAQWARLGQCYEQWGDPQRAARAYGCAVRLERAPNAGLALEAGRAAETSGDVGAALDYYIRALDNGPSSGASEQKGSLRWHEDDSPKSSHSLS